MRRLLDREGHGGQCVGSRIHRGNQTDGFEFTIVVLASSEDLAYANSHCSLELGILARPGGQDLIT